jgi:hypothetical protein
MPGMVVLIPLNLLAVYPCFAVGQAFRQRARREMLYHKFSQLYPVVGPRQPSTLLLKVAQLVRARSCVVFFVLFVWLTQVHAPACPVPSLTKTRIFTRRCRLLWFTP